MRAETCTGLHLGLHLKVCFNNIILTKAGTVLKTLVLPLNTKLYKNQFTGSGVISVKPMDGRWHGTILISAS
jgi:hypothetical protein